MSKKLQGNGLWESSRMMLPEHKESYLRLDRERGRRERPELDEQESEEIGKKIQKASETGRLIRLTVYDPFQDIEVIGQVQIIDPYEQRIRLAHDGKKTWVPLKDILTAE